MNMQNSRQSSRVAAHQEYYDDKLRTSSPNISNHLQEDQYSLSDSPGSKQQTPMQPEQVQSAVEQAQEIKKMLKVIFNYYASFGDRMNMANLKSSKFHKIMEEAQIVENKKGAVLTKKKLDIIFCSVNKHQANMSFDNFLTTLTKIAEIKYLDMNNGIDHFQALSALIHQHFLPLFQSISQDFRFNQIQQQTEMLIYDDLTARILMDVGLVLYNIYSVYFQHEFSANEKMDKIAVRSEKAFFELLRDHEICPQLLTKSAAFQIWQSFGEESCAVYEEIACRIVNSFLKGVKNPGNRFGRHLRFDLFVDAVVKCSQISYCQEDNPQYLPGEMLCLLLERMELSKGFINFEKKTFKPHMSRTSLLPSKPLIRDIAHAKLQQMEGNHDITHSPMIALSELSPHQVQQQQPEQMDIHQRSSQQLQQSDEKNQSTSFIDLQKYLEQLHKIFQSYCSFGEPMNTTKMKSSKFMKLLRDCNLVKPAKNNENMETTRFTQFPYSQVDADLLFTKLTNGQKQQDYSHKNQGYQSARQPGSARGTGARMDFDSFIQALQVISLRLFPVEKTGDPHKSLICLLEANVIQIQSSDRGIGNSHIIQLMDILQDESIVDLLGIIHKSMLPYFNHYSDQYGLLNFPAFIKFCHDFGIFPDLLPKAKIMRFFYTLSNFFQSTQHPTSTINSFNGENIDEHLFIEALSLCAMEIPYKDDEIGHREKIIYLMERMSQSDGPALVQKAAGWTRFGEQSDILHHLRIHYPEFFDYRTVQQSMVGHSSYQDQSTLNQTQNLNFDQILAGAQMYGDNPGFNNTVPLRRYKQ